MQDALAFFTEDQLHALGLSEEIIHQLKRRHLMRKCHLREGDKEITAFEADISLLRSIKVSLARGFNLDRALERLAQERQKSQFMREGRMPPAAGLPDHFD